MIRLELPWLPPSSNNAYTNNGFGGRKLSAEGKAFLIETKAHLAQHYPTQLRIFKPNKPYLVAMRFYFQELETAGFAAGKAKARYKTVDGGNRTKLLEDALKDVGGIDDSQTMVSIWEKGHAGGLNERTLIWAWSLEEEECTLYELIKLQLH